MNTIGKILVVLNLVFALLTGGFLAYDFAARSNWKQEAEHRERVFKVAKANADALQGTLKTALADKKKLQEQLDNLMIDAKSDHGNIKIKMADLEKELNAQKERTKLEILNAEKALAEAERRHKEVQLLTDVIKKREEEIAKAQLEVTKYRTAALQAEDQARTASLRAANLLEQLKQKEIQLAKALVPGGTATPTASVRDPGYQNPPPAYVKGKIEKINATDRGLVQINIGSDVGIQENNTLEVYRLRPAPEYLGRLRIVDVHHHSAIGRLMRTGAGAPPPLREGDEVASTIR
jgi:chromosome segregation ATPase